MVTLPEERSMFVGEMVIELSAGLSKSTLGLLFTTVICWAGKLSAVFPALSIILFATIVMS